MNDFNALLIKINQKLDTKVDKKLNAKVDTKRHKSRQKTRHKSRPKNSTQKSRHKSRQKSWHKSRHKNVANWKSRQKSCHKSRQKEVDQKVVTKVGKKKKKNDDHDTYRAPYVIGMVFTISISSSISQSALGREVPGNEINHWNRTFSFPDPIVSLSQRGLPKILGLPELVMYEVLKYPPT